MISRRARNIDLNSATVTVTIDGKDANSLFDVHKQDDRVCDHRETTAARHDLQPGGGPQGAHDHQGRVHQGRAQGRPEGPAHQRRLEKWNQQTVPGNEPPVRGWSPNPDKSWIKLGDDGTWQAVVDPDETNKTGADTQKFLDGDQVASVVNGVIQASDLVKVTDIKLTDDYAKADYIWDLTSDKSKIRVYEADATTDAASSVADIANKGRDVTDQFDITVSKVTATAKPEYRAAQAGLKNPKQISLLLHVVNFANGKGAAQVRKDFRKAAGDELTFCENPDGSKLSNSGSEKVQQRVPSRPTNRTSAAMSHRSRRRSSPKAAKAARTTTPTTRSCIRPEGRIPSRRAAGTARRPRVPDRVHQDTDVYDQYLEPDPQTLEITDLATGGQLTTSDPQMGVEGDYTVAWTPRRTSSPSHTRKQVRGRTLEGRHEPAGAGPFRRHRREEHYRRPQGGQPVGAHAERHDHPVEHRRQPAPVHEPLQRTTSPRSRAIRPSASTGRPCCWAIPASIWSPST